MDKSLFEQKRPSRRGFLEAAGAAALVESALASSQGMAQTPPAGDRVSRGMPPLRITDVRVIVTCPSRNYVIVKIMTNEQGLYGVGDATLNGRELAVAEDLEKHLAPLLIGRDPEMVEDTWQYLYRGPYWRSGPVQMSALAGVDVALWDIKGKRADMPVYQLLGGRTRSGARAYSHATGKDIAEVLDVAQKAIADNFTCVRLQVAIPGLDHTYGTTEQLLPGTGGGRRGDGDMGPLPETEIFEPEPYLRTIPKLFDAARKKLGDDVNLLHDCHERLDPIQGARLAHELEPYHLFYLEDCLRPEYKDGFKVIREHSTTPLAMGELFNNLWECVPLIKDNLIDYIRCDLGHIGGLTAGRKIAGLADFFEVRTAWHGPADIGPPTHAANVHIDISIPNFGIQEMVFFRDQVMEVYSGGPEYKNGYMNVSDKPGIGCDVNEDAAKKYPYRRLYLPTARRKDGSVQDW